MGTSKSIVLRAMWATEAKPKDVSEVNTIINRARDHSCDILAMNGPACSLVQKYLCQAKLKVFN